MQKTQVQSLDQEDLLEEGMATLLAWKIPWKEEPSGLQSIGSQRVRQDCVIEHANLGGGFYKGRLYIWYELPFLFLNGQCSPIHYAD